ncbi:MAG: AAA family ATPase [Spirochaetia bacterium]|nr:AAA family ATPase [Spirochaetia bacterium]
MGKIIAIANQKGGVGKTTTAINIASILSDMGKKILLVDVDPQGNAGSGIGIEVMSLKETTYQFMINNLPYHEVVKHSNTANIDVIPSNIDLSGLEVDLMDDDQKEYKLKSLMSDIKMKYDFIIVDCPPSLGLLTINALTAADSVLIPLQCEYFALEGLTQLVRIIRLVQSKLNTALKIEGVLLTMYDSRTRLSAQVVQDVKEHFQDDVYEVIIPRNIKLSEAPSFGEPIGSYDPLSSGAVAYKKLAKEILERNN